MAISIIFELHPHIYFGIAILHGKIGCPRRARYITITGIVLVHYLLSLVLVAGRGYISVL